LGFFIAAVFCMGLTSLFSVLEMGTIPIILDRVLSNQEITFIQQMPDWIMVWVSQINQMDRLGLLQIIVMVIPGLFLIKGVSLFGKNYLIAKVAQGVAKDMQDAIYKKIQELSMSYHGKQRSGELTSRITYDVTFVKNAVNENLSDLIFQGMQTLAFLAMVFFIQAVPTFQDPERRSGNLQLLRHSVGDA